MTTQTQTKTKWAIDPAHSEVTFKVRHMMISNVTGEFKKFDGAVWSNNDDFSDASAEIEIDIDSIHTNAADRDAHLKSDDFFNAEAYPKMTFKSTSFDGNTLKGDLTIRDITKPISLNVDYNGTAVDPYGQTKAGFEITGELNRKEYNLKWNAVTEAGNVVVADTIKLNLHIQLTKEA